MRNILFFLLGLILFTYCSKDEGGTNSTAAYQIQVSQPELIIENGYHPRWSPNSNFIAYTSGVGGNLEIWLFDFSSNTARSQVTGLQGDMTISWKPDGTAIAFEAFESVYDMEIWISNINTGVLTKISNNSSHLFQPDWLRTDSRICVMSRMNFYLMDEDGTNFENIGGVNLQGWSPAVKWDGGQFAFTSERSGNDDIWIANIDGSGLTQITYNSAHDGRARWSPDGTKLVFESDRSGERNIWIYDFISNTFVQVTTAGGEMPDWSSDGNYIVFVKDNGLSMVQIVELD